MIVEETTTELRKGPIGLKDRLLNAISSKLRPEARRRLDLMSSDEIP